MLPGLIDGHTHVFGFGLDGIKPGGPPFASPINDSREYRTMLALANAQKDMRAGFTTLRDLMSHGGGYADVDIKNAIANGEVPGPRMQVATRAMPGLPGAQWRSLQVGLAASACASACSRPPEPTSRILIAPSLLRAAARPRSGPREGVASAPEPARRTRSHKTGSLKRGLTRTVRV